MPCRPTALRITIFALAVLVSTCLLPVAGPAGAAQEDSAFDVWQPLGPGGDVFGLAVLPGEPPTLYTTRDFELLRRTPLDDAWRPLELELLPPYDPFPLGAAGHPRRADRLYVPELLHMRQSRDGGATWSAVPTGCVSARVFVAAPSDPERLYFSGDFVTAGCGAADLCALFRWDGTAGEAGEVTCVRQEPQPRTARVLTVDAADRDRVYALQTVFQAPPEVFVSSDGGGLWLPLSTPGPVAALAADPLRTGLIRAGGTAGEVWRSDDGGLTWTALPADGLPEAAVSLLVADPVAPDRLYAVAGGEVFAREPGAASWKVLDAGLPAAANVKKLEIDRADPSVLYALRSDGVWRLHRRLPAIPCVADATTLCLGAGDRYRVRVLWHDFTQGAGRGRAIPETDDTGAFWFFDPDNVELLVKVLDGSEVNGHRWVFYGALTNVPFTLVVTDTLTGESVGYFNPARRFGSRGDTLAFPEQLLGAPAPPPGDATPAVRDTVEPAPCLPSDSTLCLGDGGRFRAEVTWEDFEGGSGAGTAVPETVDTGYFWFFDADNLELAVKVLDGRGVNGRYWVFYGALTNVPFRLTVTDTVTGEVRTYVNPSRNFASRGDVDAFDAGG